MFGAHVWTDSPVLKRLANPIILSFGVAWPCVFAFSLFLACPLLRVLPFFVASCVFVVCLLFVCCRGVLITSRKICLSVFVCFFFQCAKSNFLKSGRMEGRVRGTECDLPDCGGMSGKVRKGVRSRKDPC